MTERIYTIDEIKKMMQPIIKKYNIQQAYLFGSYARGEATANSDIDILIKGGNLFNPVNVFAIGEELRKLSMKNIDIFELMEINKNTPFYNQTIAERILIS